MVSFKNVETSMIKEGEKIVKYGDLIVACLDTPPKGGFDIQEMKRRMRILDVVEKGGEEFSFEDADIETLKKCVSSMKWAVFHREVLAFCEAVDSIGGKKEHSC